MDESAQAARHEQATKEEIAYYRRLQNLKNSEDVSQLLDLNLKTAAQKIVQAFTTKEIKTYEDFCRLHGEVFSLLYPVQEVRGAQAIADDLQRRLNDLYSQ